MNLDLLAARDFVTTHARLLDRRRLQLLLDDGDRLGVLAALDGYRNEDGGYGWGLEPDLRTAASQPGPTSHAFEVFAEVAPLTNGRAVELCDWLASISLPDGGLPFALPLKEAVGTAPWWQGAGASISSLQITSFVATNAHRVAHHDPAVANHPWLETATDYCVRVIRALNETPHAYELLFSLRFLDAAQKRLPEAGELLHHVGRHLPRDGVVHVEGGTEDEHLRPLDFAPLPESSVRELFDAGVVEAELDRLSSDQQPDGGWPYEPKTFSPASALEWRGYETVRALSVLKGNGILGA